MQGILVLLTLLGVSYAAGYYTRDHISRRRRERARLLRSYWNQNSYLLNWEDRARARRFGKTPIGLPWVSDVALLATPYGPFAVMSVNWFARRRR